MPIELWRDESSKQLDKVSSWKNAFKESQRAEMACSFQFWGQSRVLFKLIVSIFTFGGLEKVV